MRIRTPFIFACLILSLVPAGLLYPQAGGMGLNPSRLELEVRPGQEKTTSFDIEAPPSDVPVRGQLMLSLTDWDINKDGSLRYVDASTLPKSASSWVVFSPSSVTIESGETHMVRVTVRAPQDAAPGVYRTALFVQERPPAAPAKKGEHLVFLRLRYVFTLYIIVPPVLKHAEITDLRVEESKQGEQVLFQMHNAGTSHVRPRISVSIRDTRKPEADRVNLGHYETIVLLPGNTLDQSVGIPQLTPGEYEVNIQADFQDGGALQSLSRTIRVNPTVEAAKLQADK